MYKDRLTDYLVRCDKALKQLGLEKRLIAVAGLNPHNGEHGLFGDEEGRNAVFKDIGRPRDRF